MNKAPFWKLALIRIFEAYRFTIKGFLLIVTWIIRQMPRGEIVFSDYLELISARKSRILASENEYLFSTPNYLTKYRAETLLTKEPDTINWISKFDSSDIFWDIGANVGIYSVVAAAKGCQVIAFEPSALNLECLVRNALINRLEGAISIMPLALGASTSVDTFYMSRDNFRVGGAHNSINQPINQHGGQLVNAHSILWPSITMDRAMLDFSLEQPTHIKIDVDGCEIQVIEGGLKVLQSVKSVLIEVYEDNHAASEISKMLKSAGLSRTSNTFPESSNQIWMRI